MSTPPGASVTVPNAALGPAGQGASAAVMRQAAQASATSPVSATGAAAAYTVKQTTLANGTVVREYVSQAGTVFGVAWSGPQLPDLAALLGTYFPQYVSGVEANRAQGVRGSGAVNSSGLVVHSGGHMGAFSGEAWLPQALPAGVSTSDIQ